MKFFEVGSHVGKIAIDEWLVFEAILVFHLSMNFETACIPIPYISRNDTQIYDSLFVFATEGGQFVHNFINDARLEIEGDGSHEFHFFGSPPVDHICIKGVIFGG